MQQQDTKAKRWQRPERGDAELNKICGESFKKLTIPTHWKFMEYERIRLTEDPESEIQCIAAIFVDKNTSGFNLKHYRVNFHTYSEHLSITEVSFSEFGKPHYSCKQYNKTPEQLNEFIQSLNN